MVWLTGGALAVCVVMIVGLLGLVLYQGLSTFWPHPVVQMDLADGSAVMGEVTRHETRRGSIGHPDAGSGNGDARGARHIHNGPSGDAPGTTRQRSPRAHMHERRLVRTGNFHITGTHFHWIDNSSVRRETRPQWAVVIERRSWGRFYGVPIAFQIDGDNTATTPSSIWILFSRYHGAVGRRVARRIRLQKHDIGRLYASMENERLQLRKIELKEGKDSNAWRAQKARVDSRSGEMKTRRKAIEEKISLLDAENSRYAMVMRTVDGTRATIPMAQIVRAYPANRLSLRGRVGVYLSRWWEFLSADPREANSEGGVWPAIVGTVIMTLLMSLAVVPFGVLAALYLREYAKAGPLVSAVRISVNNLAGVPSIVFGVFGLGFFCYIVGGSIDRWFFPARLPNPTYGTGGVLWAALTLALLTLPVVVVATEEALSTVPTSMREGSYACGASKWQTIRRIVLPRAMPGIMTGLILAMARGAGEVAPLMLVGAVKLAPDLPVDGIAPFLHPERSFMHLGFHIFDVGFQSQNSEAAKPMVFTTTLLLITLIAALNLTAVWIRTRLRRKFVGQKF